MFPTCSSSDHTRMFLFPVSHLCFIHIYHSCSHLCADMSPVFPTCSTVIPFVLPLWNFHVSPCVPSSVCLFSFCVLCCSTFSVFPLCFYTCHMFFLCPCKFPLFPLCFYIFPSVPGVFPCDFLCVPRVRKTPVPAFASSTLQASPLTRDRTQAAAVFHSNW